MLGILVRSRKYAETPLRRSLFLREDADTPIAVFVPLRLSYMLLCHKILYDIIWYLQKKGNLTYFNFLLLPKGPAKKKYLAGRSFFRDLGKLRSKAPDEGKKQGSA